MRGELIIQTAKLAWIQDKGRFGYEHYGVSINGAVDTYAYLMGNALVGNELTEPSIEITAFDFAVTSTRDIEICVTGAPAEIAIDSNPVESWKTTVLQAGKTLSIKKIHRGLRVYLAVGGGFDAPYTLGSCSTDTVAGIGKSLTPGQTLSLKKTKLPFNNVNRAAAQDDIPSYGSPWHIRMCVGPDQEIFSDHYHFFLQSKYRVSPQSNHIGIRLNGPKLTDFSPTQVLSRGVVPGAIQITPSGQPIVLHKGRGGTAGYPIIGVVISVDLGMLGQARPGDTVEFSQVSNEEAKVLFKEQRKRILDYLIK